MITHSRVGAARDVGKERIIASGRIVICGIGKERPGTDARIKLASGIAQKRIQTNGCIVSARCDARKGVLPFSGVASGVAAIGRWTDRRRYRRKREAG